MIDERTWVLRRAAAGPSASPDRTAPNLQYGAAFHIRVTRRGDGSSLADLLGELDVTSIAQFELAITELLSSNPRGLIFDLTQSRFVSAQGYDAIGRCSLEVPVQVRSRTGLAARVFTVLGYDRVDVGAPQGTEGSSGC